MTEHRHPREIAAEIKEPTIADLAKRVDDSRRELDNARERERMASSSRCAATNDFNAATKALDAAILKLKAAAPYGTDWAQSQSRELSE